MKKFINALFYGNLFYGLCTVALSIESNLLHDISLNSYRLYLLIFLSTVLYYSRIYYKSSRYVVDERTSWYRQNRTYIKKVLIAIAVLLVADAIYIALLNRQVLTHIPMYYWSLLAVVPVIGAMYTFQFLPAKRLRRIGWLKPFIIGFVWAGAVTIFPVMFWEIRNPGMAGPTLLTKTFIWLQNFLFISTLAIIFDIKDFQVDRKHQLQTYPAKFGVQTTIRFVIIPFTLLSYLSLIAFHFYSNQSSAQFLIQSIPYIILLTLTASFRHEKNLLFYLAVIDGLMLLKAICGIISITFF